jgi:hypothetical protein
VNDSYLGATEGELLGVPLARRLAAYSDQRRLFPHQGTLQLTQRALVLGGWRVIHREAVASVRLTFTDAYRRSQAAGIRGLPPPRHRARRPGGADPAQDRSGIEKLNGVQGLSF